MIRAGQELRLFGVLILSVYHLCAAQPPSTSDVLVYTDICDPANDDTFEVYCDGETRDTTTAIATIRGVSRGVCSEYAFGASCGGSGQATAFRVSMTVQVDEANHRGCTMRFDWGLVPLQGEDRLCNPTRCVNEKTSNPLCQRIQPIVVEIDIPLVTHERPLVAEQYSPYEYVLFQQGEYFPQRMNHFPIATNTANFRVAGNLESVIEGGVDGYSGVSVDPNRVAQVWTLIDPNYESKNDDSFYCSLGDTNDVSGRNQCCFRGLLYNADDDDEGSGSNIGPSEGTFVDGFSSTSRQSPATLQFCMDNTGSLQGRDGFAWSKADERPGATSVFYKCDSDDCDSWSGYFPRDQPASVLRQYIINNRTNFDANDDRDVADNTANSELFNAQVSGILENTDDYEKKSRSYRASLKALYPLRDAQPTLDVTASHPAWNVRTEEELRALERIVLRDAKNTASASEQQALVNGTWVVLPFQPGRPVKARRLRCGYCGASPVLNGKPCPSDQIFKPANFLQCPFGDVDSKCSSFDTANYNPELANNRCDDDDEQFIRWSEIRHPRAYARSRWFLGTNPVCAAMRPESQGLVVHQQIAVRVLRTNVPDGMQTSSVSVDLSVHSDDAFVGTSSLENAVRADMSPGLSDTASLVDASDGAVMNFNDRVVVCDSVLHEQGAGVFTKDRFAQLGSSDPFNNPFDTLTNPNVTNAPTGATCAGCTTMQQLLALNDASELLPWYYLDAYEYANTWSTLIGGFDVANFDSNDETSFNNYRDAVANSCGSAGASMDLFAVDGCDSLQSGEHILPDESASFPLPTLNAECLRLHSLAEERQRSCKSKSQYVLADALACSDRVPRVCAPTTSAPAYAINAMQRQHADAVRKINSATGATSFNDITYDKHGFPRGTNLDAPNVWLGIAGDSTSQRALYSTNRRAPNALRKRPAWRKSVVNVFVTGTFAQISDSATPCVFDIVYPSCMIATEQNNGPVAEGSFAAALSPGLSNIVPRTYQYSMYMGQNVRCELRVPAFDESYQSVVSLVVADTNAYRFDIRCTLLDNKQPVSRDETGYILVQEDGVALISVPVMSCTLQTDFMAQFTNVQTDIDYTPIYPKGVENPCSGNAAASQGQKGNLRPQVLVGDDIVITEPLVPSPSVTPAPTATPVPTTDPTEDPGVNEDNERSVNATTNPRNPTPSPSPSPSPRSDPTPTPEPGEEDITPDGEVAWGVIAAVAGGVGLLALIGCCIVVCLVQSQKKRADSSRLQIDGEGARTAVTYS